MKNKTLSPIYCVVLSSTFPRYVVLHKLFDDKDEALKYGRDLWDHILCGINKTFYVTVSVIEDPKDFNHTYGDLIKAFFLPTNEEVKAYEIEYLYDMRKLNGFINAYSEDDARMIFTKRTKLNPDSILSLKEIKWRN